MLKFQMIGYLGKDAIVQQHGTDSVINFSVAHTDKYTDAAGTKYDRVTWVKCSYWVEKTTIAQYLKKGTLIWIEGIPEAKLWKDKNGESKAFLNMRVLRVELLGGKKEEASPIPDNSSSNENSSDGFRPINSGSDDLPF